MKNLYIIILLTFGLCQDYSLNFAIPVDSEVSLSVYNLQGREVSTLISGYMDAGYHSVVWNADSHSSGVYFVKMIAGEFVNTQKLMLVK